MAEALRVELRDDIALWTIDRPEARNAVDEAVIAGLERALDEAEQTPELRAIVLTGSGNAAFVSGADLKLMRDAAPERRAENDARMLRSLERLEALPLPVFCALNGPVIGGGCEIALACDLRIAEPHASLTFKHAAMGVSPGWGGLARLCALVGYSTAARMLFTATPLSAEDALRVGLVDEVVAEGSALQHALALAEAVRQVSPSAVAGTKDLLKLAYRRGPGEAMAAERRLFLERAGSADHAEALAAFFERRRPRFRRRGEG